jgi:hypothetical protein
LNFLRTDIIKTSASSPVNFRSDLLQGALQGR